MEDKNLYNRIMLVAFCVIVILLGAGMYSWFHGRNTMPDPELPRLKVQVLKWEPGQPMRQLKESAA